MRISKDDVAAVFEKQLEYHPMEKLSQKKARLIRERFKDGYSIPDLVKAIVGCHNTPHNLGENERKTKYLGLHVSLKSENVDRFIEVGLDVFEKRALKNKILESKMRQKKIEKYVAENLTPEQKQAELEAFRAARRDAGV